MFSGAIIYESWTLSLYNVFFTVLPPLAMGILDQFVSARLLDRYPQLYNLGQSNQFFRLRVFIAWIANAVYHSLILYIGGVLLWPWDQVQGDGKIAGHWVWGTSMYGAVLLTVLGKAGLVTNNWTKYHVIAIPGSMAFWIAFIAAYATIAPMAGVSVEYHGVVAQLFPSPIFWLQMIGLPLLCLLRDIAYKYSKRMYTPQNYHHIQEIQKYNIQDYRPRYVLTTLPSTSLRLQASSLLLSPSDDAPSYNLTNGLFSPLFFTGWSNSKRRSGRSARYSACESRGATPFRRRTSRRRGCSRRTTRRRTEDGTERWRRRGRIRDLGFDDDGLQDVDVDDEIRSGT